MQGRIGPIPAPLAIGRAAIEADLQVTDLLLGMLPAYLGERFPLVRGQIGADLKLQGRMGGNLHIAGALSLVESAWRDPMGDEAAATLPMLVSTQDITLDLVNASIQIAANVPVNAIAHCLGHATPNITLAVYGHLFKRSEDQAVAVAGKLLDRMLSAIQLDRTKVYIANIVKCRPPGNREPAPDEVATCTPYLVRQIESMRSRVSMLQGKRFTFDEESQALYDAVAPTYAEPDFADAAWRRLFARPSSIPLRPFARSKLVVDGRIRVTSAGRVLRGSAGREPRL